MVEAYKKYWQGFVDFKSRTGRRDFWLAVLMNLIVSFVIGFIVGILNLQGCYASDASTMQFTYVMGPALIINGLWYLANLLPGLAIGFRRLHDTNSSGWWYLILLVPAVGPIIFIVLLCLGSVNEGNRYSR